MVQHPNIFGAEEPSKPGDVARGTVPHLQWTLGLTWSAAARCKFEQPLMFLEYRLPSCLDQAQRIRAIPVKKTDEVIIGYLNREEIQALLDAPDPSTRYGLRDRAMLHLAFAGGLRVSELVGLNLADLTLHTQPSVHVLGKGRKQRVLPLWKETAGALRDWLKVRGEPKGTVLFQNARGEPMTRSGFKYIVKKYVRIASVQQHSLAAKRVSPHSLRHSCAMNTLQATGDVRKVALWLGHASLQSTEIYLRADPTEKLEAMAAVVPPTVRRGHFRPPDKLLAMLRSKQ